MNPLIRARLPELTIVALLIASGVRLRVWGADQDDPSGDAFRKRAGAVGLQSLECIPMAETFFQAKEGSAGNKFAEGQDAIVGEGFFQIQMSNGVLAYTRNVNFKVASGGQVVTRDGFQLHGGMPPIPPETTGVVVSALGVVFVSNGLVGCACGRLSLVRFSESCRAQTRWLGSLHRNRGLGSARDGKSR